MLVAGLVLYLVPVGPLEVIRLLAVASLWLWVTVVVLTGPVYQKGVDAEGKIRTWGWGNKIAAVILTLLMLLFGVVILVFYSR